MPAVCRSRLTMDAESKTSRALADDGATRLCVWMLADADSQATAYRSVCEFFRDIRKNHAAASFLVDEVAPRAVRTLAQEGHADKAAALLAFLSSFRPDRNSRSLRFSHSAQLAQLRHDLTTYATA